MKHKIYRLLAIPVVLLCCIIPLRAQNEISNPYSGFGIGLINSHSNAILDGMGGTSYAMQNPYYINSRNPASYAAFDSLSFTADVAASVLYPFCRKVQMPNVIHTPSLATLPSACL